ncbi:hypothetical protein DESC_120024 [Desulfosarcina cetonica]|nr:hypothetical protein DESC_120024 [Desulfosarcina cetonica]
MTGDHDDLGCGCQGLDLAQHGEPVLAGHFDVGEHDGRILGPEQGKPLGFVLRRENIVAANLKIELEHLQGRFFVIDDENLRHGRIL